MKTHKYNLRSETDSYLQAQKATTFQDEQINRNRVFYCTHMNRRTQFFQKHILNDKKLSTMQIRDKLYKDIFGFTRMRKDLKPRILSILEQVVTNQRKFNYRYYLNKSCAIPIKNWH